MRKKTSAPAPHKHIMEGQMIEIIRIINNGKLLFRVFRFVHIPAETH